MIDMGYWDICTSVNELLQWWLDDILWPVAPFTNMV